MTDLRLAPSTPQPSPDAAPMEQRILGELEALRYDRATTLCIEHFGPELMTFLARSLDDADAAGDVFGQLCEDLFRTLPRFEQRCSVRTWCYKLARRATGRHLRRERRHRRGRALPAELDELVARVRTTTLVYRKTEVRDGLQRLRLRLPEEDQCLLVLRVDRRLGFREIAHVMLQDDDAPTAERLEAEAARLRKRFQLVKERLRKMAEEAGLLEQA